MVVVSSRKHKKAFSHTIDDPVCIVNNMSVIKELKVMLIPNSSFVTFYINATTITVMVIPNVETIITLIKSDIHITTIDSQIIIRCEEQVSFHYELLL